MSLSTSYVVTLQANKTVGLTAGDKSIDSTSSLKQAINNIFPNGTVFKFDIELSSNESRTINLTNLGVDRLRMVLIKSDYQFGYSISQSGSTTNSPWFLARTAFIDFSFPPPIGFADTNYLIPNVISIASPSATHPIVTITEPNPTVVVQIIVIANDS